MWQKYRNGEIGRVLVELEGVDVYGLGIGNRRVVVVDMVLVVEGAWGRWVVEAR